jgi:hypothetical protein
MELLHGTTFGNLGAILRQGLRPHAGYSPHQTKTRDAVFLTDSPEAATMYATAGASDLRSSPSDAQPVILEIDTTDLPLEPDYDDAGLTISVDLDGLNLDLRERGLPSLKIGQAIATQHLETVEDLIEEHREWGERPEPFLLDVVETQAGPVLGVGDPYARIRLPPDAERVEPQIYDEVEASWEEGSPYLLARQWLCRCVVPYGRIRGVYLPAWLPSKLGLVAKQRLAESKWTDPSLLLETGDPDWPFAFREIPMVRLPRPALDALLARLR